MRSCKRLIPVLALAITSCGCTGAKSPRDVPPQMSQAEYQTLLSNAAEQMAVVGNIPEDRQDPLPTHVWFTAGTASHSVSELVDLAIERIRKEEGRPPYAGALAQVVFRDDGSEILAEVTVGSGIGRAYWTVIFDKNMQILRYEKRIGEG